MKVEYNNSNVFDFLAEECRNQGLWDEFGAGILSHTTVQAFWERLNESMDCFRICEECGKPMIEGYVVDGRSTYCSDECLHKHLSCEEYKRECETGDSDTYWTVWYEDSITYKRKIQ